MPIRQYACTSQPVFWHASAEVPKKTFPVAIIQKDRFARGPAIHHMIYRYFIFHSQLARHSQLSHIVMSVSLVGTLAPAAAGTVVGVPGGSAGGGAQSEAAAVSVDVPWLMFH